MPRYSVGFPAFVTTTGLKTVGRMAPNTGRFIELIYLALTGAGSVTPADVAHEGSLRRLSSAGAGTLTAQTPAEHEEAGAAAGATYGVNASAEPTTYDAVDLLLQGFNQRSGFVFGVPVGQGFKFADADTNKNGGVRVRSNAAGNIDFSAHVYEP